MIKAVCSIIVGGRACFTELLILHIWSCLNWVMTASILLRPSVTVWILRTVVPGGTSLERLSEWTGHWPWHRVPSNRKKNRWHKWCITKSLCRAGYLLKIIENVINACSSSMTHWSSHTHFTLLQCNIYSAHTCIYAKNLFVLVLLYYMYVTAG